MMTAATLDTAAFETVRQSYGRSSMTPGFFEAFYDRFTAKSPTIRQMFAATDMAAQRQALRSGIAFLVQYAGGSQFAASKVDQLGESHRRDRLNVSPSMYPMWVDSLIATLADKDPYWTSELDLAWRDVLQQGIDRMIAAW
jgi:hemoglobin-like flavoprotein